MVFSALLETNHLSNVQKYEKDPLCETSSSRKQGRIPLAYKVLQSYGYFRTSKKVSKVDDCTEKYIGELVNEQRMVMHCSLLLSDYVY